MRLLLDTQAFLVLALESGPALSRKTREQLADSNNDRLFSTISLTEITIKTGLKKLALSKEKIGETALEMRLTIISYTPSHANWLFDLPRHHNDPFDRMLIATALAEGVPIVTADPEFKRYKGLSVLW